MKGGNWIERKINLMWCTVNGNTSKCRNFHSDYNCIEISHQSILWMFKALMILVAIYESQTTKKERHWRRYTIRQRLAFLYKVDWFLTPNTDLSLNSSDAELYITDCWVAKRLWQAFFRSLHVCSMTPIPKSDLHDIEKMMTELYAWISNNPKDTNTIQCEVCYKKNFH